MRLYSSLQGVLTEEQLNEFKEEVEKTIAASVEERLSKVEKIAENYVNETVAEKVAENKAEMEKVLEEQKAELARKNDKELDENLEQFAQQLRKQIREEFEQKAKEEDRVTLEQFHEFEKKFMAEEQKAVKALDTFLNEQIAEKISDRLIKESVVSNELGALVDGIKMLFEEHYSPIDPTAAVKKLRQENKALLSKVESLTEERAELVRTKERAATALLISEKTKDLSPSQAEEVRTFFEGRGFDFVRSRIDKMVEKVEEKSAVRNRPVRQLNETFSDGDFIEDVANNMRGPSEYDIANQFMD